MAKLTVLIKQHHFSMILLFMMMFMLSLALPNGLPLRYAEQINTLFFSLLLLSSLYASSYSRRSLIILLVLIVLGVQARAAYWLYETAFFFIAYHLLYIVFLLFISCSIMLFLFKHQKVNANMISASLCNFLFMGLLWAVVYSLLEYILPGSFHLSSAMEMSSQQMQFGAQDSIYAVYYSFVTLTTLGYGDIYPLAPMAQMLAAIEALTGQVYLVVIVARLVGLHIAYAD